MMASTVLLAAASLAAAALLYTLLSLFQSYKLARASGFHRVVLPTHLMSVSWLLASTLFLPLLELLPEKVRGQWIPLLLLDRIWGFGYTPFAIAGTDSVIAASPFQLTLFTCDPELVTQLLRNSAFGKPTEMLALLNVFGPSLTGTDGAENRLFRRVVAPFFNKRTMSTVARESIEATQDLLKLLSTRKTPIDKDLRFILGKMALHILGRTAFDKEGTCQQELSFEEKCPPGHKLSFADTFLGIDQHLPVVALTPLPVLRRSPPAIHQRAHLLHVEMTKYLEDAVTRGELNAAVTKPERRSLLDILVGAGREGILTPSQVMGNIFIMNFAGHESNAQGIFFALLHLASQPEMQAQVQRNLDLILGETPADQWSYEQHYQALSESMLGAVINESLRVYTVLPVLLKHTTSHPVTVTLAGRKHVIPPNTLIFVNTSATHRNPRYWPASRTKPSDDEHTDASAFNPYQWLPDRNEGKFLSPAVGSFVPFSDGARGCLGQQFASVELCFTLARLLKDHTIELAIDAAAA